MTNLFSNLLGNLGIDQSFHKMVRGCRTYHEIGRDSRPVREVVRGSRKGLSKLLLVGFDGLQFLLYQS